MFTRKLLLLALCVTLPAMSWAHEGSDLLNPDFVKKFLPAEYHSSVESTIGALKGAIGADSGSSVVPATPPTLGGITGQINTSTPVPSIPMPPGPLQYTPPIVQPSPSFNPYMPSAPANNNIQFQPPAPVAPAPVSSVPLPVANSAPAMSSGPVNPFTNPQPIRAVQPSQNLILKADLNANPVFHPPLESKVPEYPPIEGQHWYQYVVVDESLNPL
jgi:hypothetical protein